MPKRDNSTRWNSIYRMIKRALKLRHQVEHYTYYTCRDSFEEAMRLNEDDWYILTQLADALQYFEDATIALEGCAIEGEFGSIGECIPVIEDL